MDPRDLERLDTDEVIGESTLPRLFEESVARYGERDAQAYKGGVHDRSLAPIALPVAPSGEYLSLSYGELRDVVRSLAAGFRDLGVRPGDRVAIFSNTRMEWVQADLALLSRGTVVTTVYAKASPERVRHVLADSDATGVVVEDEDRLERVLAVVDDVDLEFVVTVDDCPDRDARRSDVHTLGEVYERGMTRFDLDVYRSRIDAIDPGDLATIVYTSGTAGEPKGVMLSHANVRANLNQLRTRFRPRPDGTDVPSIDEGTRTLSFLPLAHVFERTCQLLVLASGGCTAFAAGPDTLAEDVALVRPTTITGVPLLYERLLDAARQRAGESSIGGPVFDWAVDVGVDYHTSASPGVGLRLKHRVADALVFSSVREALGGNVELLVCGGDSLDPDRCALYHAMGLPIYEGYGLTETAPVVSVNPPADPKVGTVGPPLPGVSIRLDPSVPTPDGTETDGAVGELLVRGPNVAGGYWNDPTGTAEAFTGDGWFRTGDVVRIRPDGYLVFVERLKEVLVLSTGKNVAPGPVEQACTSTKLIEDCVAVGDGRRFVAALVVPDVDAVRSWAKRSGVSVPSDPEGYRRHAGARTQIERDVDRVNERLEPHERIRAFRMIPDAFGEENDLLTPTMKKKRRAILDCYADEVADMYGRPVRRSVRTEST